MDLVEVEIQKLEDRRENEWNLLRPSGSKLDDDLGRIRVDVGALSSGMRIRTCLPHSDRTRCSDRYRLDHR